MTTDVVKQIRKATRRRFTAEDKIIGNFWVIVNNVRAEPNAFVTLPSEWRVIVKSCGWSIRRRSHPPGLR